MDTIAGYLTYKAGTKFGLKTAHGKMDFALTSPVPGINIGDMIILVFASTSQIVSITDVTTGVFYTYEPSPPFKPETMPGAALALVMLCVWLLPLIGWYLYVIHIEVMLIASFFVGYIIFHFLDWYRRARNHNVKIREKIAAAALNASCNPKIWSIPAEPGSPDHAERL